MLEDSIFCDYLSEDTSLKKKLWIEIKFWLLPTQQSSKFNPWLRMLHKAHKNGNRIFEKILYNIIFKRFFCEISPKAVIGKRLFVPHPNGIVIGHNAIIGEDCTIYHRVTIGQKGGEYPQIGNNVIIYPNATIVGGVKIGDRAIIGANAFVNKDVPEGAIVGGVPAKVISVR